MAALVWLFSSFHQISPVSQAVVYRFGKPLAVKHSGILFAWPKPIDRSEIIPGSDRILQHDVKPLQRSEQLKLLTVAQLFSDAGTGAGYLLTGYAGVVQLNMQVFYRIQTPLRYVLQRPHIDALIDRLGQRAATLVCAGRDLDTVLVARPETMQNDSHAAQERAKLRGDLKQMIEQDLLRLKGTENDPGITIERVDIASSLPANAVAAFNSVLMASQQAEQKIAQAQNEATRLLQKSQQEANRIVQQAEADRSEMHAKAEVATQSIIKLAQARAEGSKAGLLQRIWRERVSSVLSSAGQVTAVNPEDSSNMILSGPASQTETSSSSLQLFGSVP